jgi:microcystin-dependent protein
MVTYNPPSLVSIKRFTTNFSMAVPNFDAPGWGTALERNIDIIDAALYLAIGITNIKGAWENATAYIVGDRVVNTTNNTIYQCLVAHTSASTGTFDDEITAHPTYWKSLASSVSIRAWVTATQYSAGEYITDSSRTGIATVTFTSGASYDDDVTADNIVTIVDTSAFDAVNVAIHATAAATLADGDEIGFVDVSAANGLAKITWANVKVLLGAIYQPLDAILTATTASFTTTLKTKLDGISTSADVAITSVNAAAEKATPVDADHVVITDSAASNGFKRLLFSDLAAWIMTKLGLVGIMVDYVGTTAPTYWALAYGQSELRSAFPALFAVIGTTYGAADATHFNFPDCRGRVTAGQDDMGGSSANRLTGLSGGVDGDTLGAVGGSESHVLTIGQLPAHDHSVDPPSTTTSSNSHSHLLTSDGEAYGANGVLNTGEFMISGGDVNSAAVKPSQTTSSDSHSHTVNIAAFTSGSTGSGSAHNNVQPTIIMNKLIFTGV